MGLVWSTHWQRFKLFRRLPRNQLGKAGWIRGKD
jgi:hypothetical protein